MDNETIFGFMLPIPRGALYQQVTDWAKYYTGSMTLMISGGRFIGVRRTHYKDDGKTTLKNPILVSYYIYTKFI